MGVASVPVLWMYRFWGAGSILLNTFLLCIAGFLTNGPYALVSTVVAADLGSKVN